MSDQEFYFKRKGDKKVRGPYPFSRLKLNAKEGKIKADDMLSEDGKMWKKASAIPGLFSKPKSTKLQSKRLKGGAGSKPKSKRPSSRSSSPGYDDAYEERSAPKKNNAAFAYWEQRPEEAPKKKFEGIKISPVDAVKIVLLLVGAYLLYYYVIEKGVFDKETPEDLAAKAKEEKKLKKEQIRQEKKNRQANNNNSEPSQVAKTDPMQTKASAGKVVKERSGEGMEGMSPLSQAVYAGDLEKVVALLESGADPSGIDGERNPPLAWAIHKDFPSIFDTLLKHKANINALDPSGIPMIVLATQKNRPDMVRKLIGAGAKVNIKSDKGETALDWAIDNESSAIQKVLRDNGGASFKELSNYVRYGASAKVEAILKKDPSFALMKSSDQETLLHHAILCIDAGQRKKIVELLLKTKISVNAANTEGLTAIHLATHRLDVDLVSKLVNAGAKGNVKSKEESPLSFLMSQDHDNALTIAEMLAKAGADIHYQDRLKHNLLHMAAKNGNDKMLRWALAKGAKKDHKNFDGKTPLQLAEAEGHKSCVELLK